MFGSPRRLAIASLVVWAMCVVLSLSASAPLAHDEAAYAVLARDRDDAWLYRPIGTVALARIGIALGGSDLAMRLPSALISLALIGAVAVLGKRLGAWTGAWAAAVIAGTHAFVIRGHQLLNDLPSTACLLLALAILIDELDHGRDRAPDRGRARAPDRGRDRAPDRLRASAAPTYRLVAVAPLFAAALYLRYGALLSIAIIGLGTALVWWRELLARPGPAIAAVALFAALIAPLLAYSAATTGSPGGLFALSRGVATNELGKGLARFVLSNPFRSYGALAAPVALAGLIALVRPPPHRRRVTWFLGGIAIAQIGALGVFSDGSARFVFLALAILVLLGVDAIARAARRLGRPDLLARGAAAAVALGWLGMICASVPIQRAIARTNAGMSAASAAIRVDADGQPCLVISAQVPQLRWYTGCAARKLRTSGALAPLPADIRAYAVEMPHGPLDPAPLARALGTRLVPLTDGAWCLRPAGPRDPW